MRPRALAFAMSLVLLAGASALAARERANAEENPAEHPSPAQDVEALKPFARLAPDKTPWARFAFAKPDETTVEEAIRRAGEPYTSHEAYVLEDEIDVLGARAADLSLLREVHERARARGVRVIKVAVLKWSVPERFRPIATFVFRGGRLWYAMTVPSPAETTPEQLTARYGREPRISIQTRRMADVIYSVKVYAYPELGVAYAQVRDDRIETKLVFPPTAVNPFGLSVGFVDPAGHLNPAAFDFVRPGEVRSKVDKRLGEPYVSSPSVTVKGKIDLFVDEAPTGPSKKREPQPTQDVHYYEYRPDKHPSQFARIVFRGDTVWYAMLPPRPSERTREQIFSRYGNVFEEKKIQRRSGHIYSVDVILWLRKEGLGFAEKPGQGITHRIVFPPGSELRWEE